jgi:hypothetical protein
VELMSALHRLLRTHRLILASVGASLALVAPSTAAAQFAGVFGDYKGDQAISACSWSPGQLRGALGQTPPDIAQYAPGFIDAVNGALYTHAQGGCGAQPTAAAQAPTGGSAPPGLVNPGPTPKPPPVVKADPVLASAPVPPVSGDVDLSGSAPWPPLALAGLAAITLLLGGFGLARHYRLAEDELAGVPSGGGGRLADAVATLADRLRLGR